jgi:hypothetical protein
MNRFSHLSHDPSWDALSLDQYVDRLTDGPIAPEVIADVRDQMQVRMHCLLAGELSQLIAHHHWVENTLSGPPRHDIVSTQYDEDFWLYLESIHKGASRASPLRRQRISMALDGELFYEIETKPEDGGRSLTWGKLIAGEHPLVLPSPLPSQTFEYSALTGRVLLLSLVAQRNLCENWIKSESSIKLKSNGAKDDILHDAMVLSRCLA